MQQVVADLAAHDIALFAISYDSVETLRSFADQHHITYPLLSDEGSRVIRQVGMLDEDLDRHHAEFGVRVQEHQRGVAYPAVLLLDRDGIVAKTRFHPNYRLRDTGAGLIETLFEFEASEHGSGRSVASDIIQLRTYLDSPTYRPYQVFHLVVELTIEHGYHVYGRPIPEGYVPLDIAVASLEGLVVGDVVWPVPHPFTVEGIDEDFRVYEGTARGTLPLHVVKRDAGDLLMGATISYQACSQTTCLRPAQLSLVLSIGQVARVQ